MFNKKKIEEIEASIKNLSNKISELESQSDQKSEELQSQSDQISELQAQFEQILDKLDDETFTKDWDEYLKWKEMRDQLPDIEEMYNLKTLKRLLAEYDEEKRLEKGFLQTAAMAGIGFHSADSVQTKKNALEMVIIHQQYGQTIEKKIHQSLEKIGKQKNKKELIGIFKLYGISTDWIKP